MAATAGRMRNDFEAAARTAGGYSFSSSTNGGLCPDIADGGIDLYLASDAVVACCLLLSQRL